MSGTFRFGEFELDTAAYALRRAGERIRLEKLPMELLILLVERAGTLLDRRDIRVSLWGSHVFVETRLRNQHRRSQDPAGAWR